MKNLALILGLMIAASPAFASRARLEALGEGKNGSYYINDSRNIFLNPAQIVKHKKKLWLELGGESTAVDSSTAPRGQGGFSNTFGDFTYGLYMNQTSERALGLTALANAASGAALLAPDSQIEGFFAGEGALNWGISLFYAGNRAGDKTASLFGTRLGIESGNLSVFTSVGINSNSKNPAALGGTELKGKVSVDAAVTYAMDAFTWFGKFSTFGSDLVTTTPASTTAGRQQNYGLGFGYTHEWSKTVTMFGRLEADYQKQTQNDVSTSTIYNVPVAVGAEAQALSWLAVRGSIQQSLLGQNTTTRTDLSGTTTVATGLGATFGDVNIDGLVSFSNANSVIDGTPGFGTAPQSKGNFGFGDNMLTRVAMTYNF